MSCLCHIIDNLYVHAYDRHKQCQWCREKKVAEKLLQAFKWRIYFLHISLAYVKLVRVVQWGLWVVSGEKKRKLLEPKKKRKLRIFHVTRVEVTHVQNTKYRSQSVSSKLKLIQHNRSIAQSFLSCVICDNCCRKWGLKIKVEIVGILKQRNLLLLIKTPSLWRFW